MNATLTSKLYTAMKDGPCWHVSGQLTAGEHTWHVSVFLTLRPDGRWRLGRPTDSAAYILNHVIASIPARHGSHREASNRDRRELLRQIYEYIDRETGFALTAPSSAKDAPATKETTTMQCTIYRKYGLGERCTGTAVEDDPRNRCKLHVHLETLCGELPQQPGDFRPPHLKKAAKVTHAVSEAVTALAPVELSPEFIGRSMLASAAVPAPVIETPSTETKPKATKKARTKKAKTSPKA